MKARLSIAIFFLCMLSITSALGVTGVKFYTESGQEIPLNAPIDLSVGGSTNILVKILTDPAVSTFSFDGSFDRTKYSVELVNAPNANFPTSEDPDNGNSISWIKGKTPSAAGPIASGNVFQFVAATLGGAQGWLQPPKVHVLTLRVTGVAAGSAPLRLTAAQVNNQPLANLPSLTINVGQAPAPPAAFQCTGAIPANAALCTDDSTGLAANTARVAVAACGANKCEYQCAVNSVFRNNNCIVPEIQPRANGRCDVADDIALHGALICVANPRGGFIWKVQVGKSCVGATTACISGTTCSPQNICVAQTFSCQGSPIPHATLCPQDDEGLLANANNRAFDACTNDRKCQYACNVDYVVNALGACVAQPDAREIQGGNCPADQTLVNGQFCITTQGEGLAGDINTDGRINQLDVACYRTIFIDEPVQKPACFTAPLSVANLRGNPLFIDIQDMDAIIVLVNAQVPEFSIDAGNARNYVILYSVLEVLEDENYQDASTYKRISLFAKKFKDRRNELGQPQARDRFIIDTGNAENQAFLEGVLANLPAGPNRDARVDAARAVGSQHDHVRRGN